ncbi:MAG: RluA family pseudouridine synthase [Vicinamibacteria bacterium]
MIEILHQDADVVAVVKPPGLAVVPARGESPAACLRHRLEAQLGEGLYVVHRIDREASGLVLFARHAQAHRALSMEFEARRATKRYLAFVAGRLQPEAGSIDVPLHDARRGKTRPARPGEPGARASLTEYRTLRAWRRAGALVSLVEAAPRSGRHHQLRVHLRYAGAPILFDPLYAKGVPAAVLAGAPARRLALHAEALCVASPAGGPPLDLHAPLPADLAELRAWLDFGWSA